MSDEDNQHEEAIGQVLTQPKAKFKRPPMYKVILLNDDYTPMDFVIEVLCQFFDMSREKAIRVMLQVHTEGSGICGVYTAEIAETKVLQVNNYARAHQHPLLCIMEEA